MSTRSPHSLLSHRTKKRGDNSVCFGVPGDSEAAGLSAAGQLTAGAVQRALRRGGQVPAHLHAPQTAAGAREDAAVRGGRGALLPPQALPRAVQHTGLRAQLRASCALQVSVVVFGGGVVGCGGVWRGVEVV